MPDQTIFEQLRDRTGMSEFTVRLIHDALSNKELNEEDLKVVTEAYQQNDYREFIKWYFRLAQCDTARLNRIIIYLRARACGYPQSMFRSIEYKKELQNVLKLCSLTQKASDVFKELLVTDDRRDKSEMVTFIQGFFDTLLVHDSSNLEVTDYIDITASDERLEENGDVDITPPIVVKDAEGDESDFLDEVTCHACQHPLDHSTGMYLSKRAAVRGRNAKKYVLFCLDCVPVNKIDEYMICHKCVACGRIRFQRDLTVSEEGSVCKTC